MEASPAPRVLPIWSSRARVAAMVVAIAIVVVGSVGAAQSHAATPGVRHSHRAGSHRRHHHHAKSAGRHGVQTGRAAGASQTGLVFGIYPGQGPSAAFGPMAGQLPEDPGKRLAALEALRGSPDRPFVMHLYAGYMGPGSASAWRIAGHQAASYEAAGFDVELVLRYRAQNDVPGYVKYVRDAVRAFGTSPRFVSLQVTNEADETDCPACSDGSYPGVEDALLAGIVAAKQEASSDGFDQIKLGFNVSTLNTQFWSYLEQHGTPAFRQAVDWVGLDSYPSTSSSLFAVISEQVSSTLTTALTALRATLMPLAGLGKRVALHLSEQGYPTTSSITDAMQSVALGAAVTAINLLRTTDNITQYNWFDLRDAYPVDSTAPIYGQYGLMTADYVPKPAFNTYRQLIATLG